MGILENILVNKPKWSRTSDQLKNIIWKKMPVGKRKSLIAKKKRQKFSFEKRRSLGETIKFVRTKGDEDSEHKIVGHNGEPLGTISRGWLRRGGSQWVVNRSDKPAKGYASLKLAKKALMKENLNARKKKYSSEKRKSLGGGVNNRYDVNHYNAAMANFKSGAYGTPDKPRRGSIWRAAFWDAYHGTPIKRNRNYPMIYFHIKAGKDAAKMNKIKESAADLIGKKTLSVDDIAKKHGLSVDQIKAQVAKGISVEREHTNSDAEAEEIARDHLDEFPDYYDRLDKMETKAKKDMKNESKLRLAIDQTKQDLYHDGVNSTHYNLKGPFANPKVRAKWQHTHGVPSEAVKKRSAAMKLTPFKIKAKKDMKEEFSSGDNVIVTKDVGGDKGPFRHDPWFSKGDKLTVKKHHKDGHVSVTTRSGERIGIKIPATHIVKESVRTYTDLEKAKRKLVKKVMRLGDKEPNVRHSWDLIPHDKGDGRGKSSLRHYRGNKLVSKKYFDSAGKRVNEDAPAMSVASGAIAGMPTADSADKTPVRRPMNPLRRKQFAGKTVFVVDPTTYHKAHLGKRKYEHYEKYLEGCDIADYIREYGRKYWAEPIILENEQTGAMIYLKYGSK